MARRSQNTFTHVCLRLKNALQSATVHEADRKIKTNERNIKNIAVKENTHEGSP
mgnify:CR=1 FL=1